jgi:hypothetical protein
MALGKGMVMLDAQAFAAGRNPFPDRLRAGELMLGIRSSRTADVVRIARETGLPLTRLAVRGAHHHHHHHRGGRQRSSCYQAGRGSGAGHQAGR